MILRAARFKVPISTLSFYYLGGMKLPPLSITWVFTYSAWLQASGMTESGAESKGSSAR
ncbi:MAG: hypothetical protein JHC13_02690 [Acidilobus sp.]|nr:hypothetical protein [Acidilobus sp.]